MVKYNTKAKLFSVILIILLSILYSLPNLYGEQPAIQLKSNSSTPIDSMVKPIKSSLLKNKINFEKITLEQKHLVIAFQNTEQQLKAKDFIEKNFDQLTSALYLKNKTPAWLKLINANPMKLGLDLRGGVHFLLNVDITTALKLQNQQNAKDIKLLLRKKNIKVISSKSLNEKTILINIIDDKPDNLATKIINTDFNQYIIKSKKTNDRITRIILEMNQEVINQLTNYTLEKTITTINNRVNELGVSEAVISRNGTQQISVDLPGIQDIARAKSLLGKTATLYFYLVDDQNNINQALSGITPNGSKLYYDEYSQPVLLKQEPILSGDSITYASMQFSQGKPAVSIKLGGGKEAMFHKQTRENIGRALAVVYVDTEMVSIKDGDRTTIKPIHHEKIISIATIQSALGQQFEITGLKGIDYADNLALLLRSGSLAAPVNIIQELTIGPSLGQANIDKGIFSLVVGSVLVILFMLFYYRLFGLVANLAIIVNILLIIAILSIIEATLTLPGIAGIVLTVGMAVDANVLINERIREEIRLGLPTKSSIKAGYERAFSTILDSNITTLIVAMILFTLGSGTVKGFAVTLTIGLIASMFTSIVVTRVIIEMIYTKSNKPLSIGI